MSIDRYVAQSIAEIAVFFEFAEESLVDPDVAVDAVEQLAGTLKLARFETRYSLCLMFKEISRDYSDDRAVFLDGLGEMLGLLGD